MTSRHKDQKRGREFSYLFDAGKITKAAHTVTLSAEKTQREGLARRLGIPAIHALSTDMTLERDESGHMITVRGRIHADVTQTCVITLDPLRQTLESEFTACYADKERIVHFAKARNDMQVRHQHIEVPMLEEHEDPEALEDGHIDLGELTAQQLSLALPDFPHAEGARHPLGDDDNAEIAGRTESVRPNPFSGLKNWRGRNGED